MHSFDPKIAEMVGLAPAVIYQNICWWIAKNEANEQNFYDGHDWTYNSVKAFSTLFPYLTEKQIRTSLDKLVEVGLLVTGNYNASAYDRTKWFRLSTQIHLPQKANQLDPQGEPIPDIKPHNKPDVLDTNVSMQNKRGTRIKADWQPSQDDYNQALSMGLTVEQVDNEANKFRDYWIAKAGSGGVKLNWSATWRNWCRTAKSRIGAPSYSSSFPNKQGLGGRAGAALRSLQERAGMDRDW
jgi:hypothetical protein